MKLVKDGKEDFIQGEVIQWGFFSRGETLDLSMNVTRKSRDL